MKTTIQNTKRLIRSLQRSNKVDVFSYMATPEDKDWYYYYDLGGFLNENYFSIIISHCKGSEHGEVKFNSSDDKKEIEQLLIKFDLLKP